ncbi:MAG TPA: hypothetical protein VG873_11715 [Burkholderiales bacterium]|nr:hypothetical protein [Burkholderiales bacterium]
MRRLLFITFLLFVTFPLAATFARAQTANEEQNRIVGEVAACLQAGLPPDWASAEMRVELKKPGAESGDVSYVMRRKLSGGAFEPFRPCDEKQAARTLLEIRKSQPKERRAWTGAKLTLHSEGKYDLTFDYTPK